MFRNIRRRDHCSPARSTHKLELVILYHWLPIVCRVDCKLLVLTYKAMHNDAPVYLCELVYPYQPTRTLCSANNSMLQVKRTRTANSTGCPLCAELIASYLYSLTKPCTTTRLCICVNSCVRITVA